MFLGAGYRDPNTRDVARVEKRVKKHEALGECFLAFRKSSTSHVFGSRYKYPARKTFWYLFYKITTRLT